MILQIIISNGILDLVTGILAKISLGTGIWAKFRLGTGIWYPPSRPSKYGWVNIGEGDREIWVRILRTFRNDLATKFLGQLYVIVVKISKNSRDFVYLGFNDL